jgi:hypothetical protein
LLRLKAGGLKHLCGNRHSRDEKETAKMYLSFAIIDSSIPRLHFGDFLELLTDGGGQSPSPVLQSADVLQP